MSYSVEGVGGNVWGHDNLDNDGNPAGGYSEGTGYRIDWQDGPVNREAGEQPSGAFIEDVVMSCIMRLKFYQGEPYVPGGFKDSDGRFACEENGSAINHLENALECMMSRRKDRANRGVLGKHAA